MPSNSSPYSYVKYVSSGTGPFVINIDYLTASHLEVSINGVTLDTTAYTIDTNANTVTLASPAATGSIIIIQRTTPKGKSGFQSDVADFSDGSVLTADDLDQAALGLLYVAQEADDSGSANALNKDLQDDKFDAEGLGIKDVANPTNDSDAVTKQYVDGLSLYNSPTALSVYTFPGDASTTAFTMDPAPGSTDAKAFIVDVGGVTQRPTTDYTISGAVITFVSPPPSATITVRNIGVARDTLAQPIVADGSAVSLTVKEKSGQTSNLQEWQNTAGTAQASVDKSGNAAFADVTAGGALTASGIMNVVGALQFDGQAGIKIHSIGQFELIDGNTYAYNTSQVNDDAYYMVSGLKYEVTPKSANSKFAIIGQALTVMTANGDPTSSYRAGIKVSISLNNTADKGAYHNGTRIGGQFSNLQYVSGGGWIHGNASVSRIHAVTNTDPVRFDVVHRPYVGTSLETESAAIHNGSYHILVIEYSE